MVATLSQPLTRGNLTIASLRDQWISHIRKCRWLFHHLVLITWEHLQSTPTDMEQGRCSLITLIAAPKPGAPASADQRQNKGRCAVQPAAAAASRVKVMSAQSSNQSPLCCAQAEQHPLSEGGCAQHAANIPSPIYCRYLCMSPMLQCHQRPRPPVRGRGAALSRRSGRTWPTCRAAAPRTR